MVGTHHLGLHGCLRINARVQSIAAACQPLRKCSVPFGAIRTAEGVREPDRWDSQRVVQLDDGICCHFAIQCCQHNAVVNVAAFE